jgi:hypothetical protein
VTPAERAITPQACCGQRHAATVPSGSYVATGETRIYTVAWQRRVFSFPRHVIARERLKSLRMGSPEIMRENFLNVFSDKS